MNMHAADRSLDMVQTVRRGAGLAEVQAILAAGTLTATELDHVVLPRRTLAHRRKLGSLTPEQADRLLRVRRILDMAAATFGSPDTAGVWLRRTNAVLSGERPIDLLDTDTGTRMVENLLGRIDHGVAA
jgi:putative toxin-antitoxin system antitoxin component (TIGR02293 family)